jgi:hypothetical protein
MRIQNWLLDLFTLIRATTDYIHLEQFLQQLAPKMHVQLLEFFFPVNLLCCELLSSEVVPWATPQKLLIVTS